MIRRRPRTSEPRTSEPRTQRSGVSGSVKPLTPLRGPAAEEGLLFNTADVYSFDVAAPGCVSVAAATGNTTVGQARVLLALYAPGVDPISGTPLRTSTTAGTLDGLMEYNATTAGTYKVKVTPGPAVTAGNVVSYGLVAVTNGSFEAIGAAASFATAQDITGRPGVVGSQRQVTSTFVAAGSGGLNRSIGLAFGPDGKLFVSSFNSDQVMRYQGPSGVAPGTPSPAPGQSGAVFVTTQLGGLDNPEYLRFGPDGNLYVVSSPTNQVLRYNGQTGAFIDGFVKAANNGGLAHPLGLAFDAAGNLYVGGGDSNNVVRFDSGGNPNPFVASGSGGLRRPEGLTFGPDGNLYVSSSVSNHAVLRYNGVTGAFIDAFVPSRSGGLGNPTGLAFGPDGNLYVSSVLGNAVLRYDGATGAFLDAFLPTNSGGLTRPTDLAFGPDGTLYVTTENASSVLAAAASADYYRVTLSAGQTEYFSTATPGDGAGQPVNLLDPRLELYDAARTLVAVGTPLADGRNEAIAFAAPAAGTYYVKVARERFTEGDYVLDPVPVGGARRATAPPRRRDASPRPGRTAVAPFLGAVDVVGALLADAGLGNSLVTGRNLRSIKKG